MKFPEEKEATKRTQGSTVGRDNDDGDCWGPSSAAFVALPKRRQQNSRESAARRPHHRKWEAALAPSTGQGASTGVCPLCELEVPMMPAAVSTAYLPAPHLLLLHPMQSPNDAPAKTHHRANVPRTLPTFTHRAMWPPSFKNLLADHPMHETLLGPIGQLPLWAAVLIWLFCATLRRAGLCYLASTPIRMYGACCGCG